MRRSAFCPSPSEGCKTKSTSTDRRVASYALEQQGLVGRPGSGLLMAKAYSSSRDPLVAGQQPHCPKCDSAMHLLRVARGPSGFDIRTFDCAKCDHAHIVTVATDLVSDGRSLFSKSIDALEEAREMPPGAPRTDALKKAGLLRRTADNQGLIFAKRGRPRKL